MTESLYPINIPLNQEIVIDNDSVLVYDQHSGSQISLSFYHRNLVKL